MNGMMLFIENFNQDVDFYPLSYALKCDLNGNPHHPNLQIKELIFDQFFIEHPQEIVFVVGAQFIVNRKAILKRRRDFYIELLKKYRRAGLDFFCFAIL